MQMLLKLVPALANNRIILASQRLTVGWFVLCCVQLCSAVLVRFRAVSACLSLRLSRISLCLCLCVCPFVSVCLGLFVCVNDWSTPHEFRQGSSHHCLTVVLSCLVFCRLFSVVVRLCCLTCLVCVCVCVVSPRRQELLEKIGLSFDVIPSL